MAKEQDRPKSKDSKPVRRSARVANNGVVLKEVVVSARAKEFVISVEQAYSRLPFLIPTSRMFPESLGRSPKKRHGKSQISSRHPT